MRISRVQIQSYKRFNHLTISDLPATTRLVMMAGPNGSGKSSLFDAFRTWHSFYGIGGDRDYLYHHKRGLPTIDWSQYVTVEFDQPIPNDQELRKKMFYIRSAYRNQ